MEFVEKVDLLTQLSGNDIDNINLYLVRTLYLLCGHEIVFRVHIILISWPQMSILWPRISILCARYSYIVATIQLLFFDHVMSGAP